MSTFDICMHAYICIHMCTMSKIWHMTYEYIKSYDFTSHIKSHMTQVISLTMSKCLKSKCLICDIWLHRYMQISVSTRACMMFVSMYAYIYILLFMFTHTRFFPRYAGICVYWKICRCIYMYVRIYTCMCMSKCVFVQVHLFIMLWLFQKNVCIQVPMNIMTTITSAYLQLQDYLTYLLVLSKCCKAYCIAYNIYVCTRTYMFTHTCTCIHADRKKRWRLWEKGVCANIYICVFVHVYICIYILMHIHVFIYIFVCTYIFIYAYICMYSYAFLYIHMNTHMLTHTSAYLLKFMLHVRCT